MDASVLPEIFALAVCIFLFQPIVSRIGRHADTWLAGWIFLLGHYLVHGLIHLPGTLGVAAILTSVALVQLAGHFFLRASGNIDKKRIDWLLTISIAVPLFLQGALAVLKIHNPLLQRLVAIMLFAPGAYVLQMRPRIRSLTGIALAFAVIGVVAVTLPKSDPVLVSFALLMFFFFGIAATYLDFAPRLSRASIVAVAGLITWGLTFPITAAAGIFWPRRSLNHGLVMIPQFIFMAGIVFSFIEEVVTHAEHMAQHDPLTGLPNARLFHQRATAAMEQASATGTPLAFLVIDVDEFKKVNDTLGHNAGDELLRSLAVRLSWHIGSGDMLARTGGDEFTAILAGVVDEHHLRFIARAMMSAASVPFIIAGNSVDCRISIGIAVAPRIAQDITSLREAADQAMYHAKRNGGSLLAFANEDRGFAITG